MSTENHTGADVKGRVDVPAQGFVDCWTLPRAQRRRAFKPFRMSLRGRSVGEATDSSQANALPFGPYGLFVDADVPQDRLIRFWENLGCELDKVRNRGSAIRLARKLAGLYADYHVVERLHAGVQLEPEHATVCKRLSIFVVCPLPRPEESWSAQAVAEYFHCVVLAATVKVGAPAPASIDRRERDEHDLEVSTPSTPGDQLRTLVHVVLGINPDSCFLELADRCLLALSLSPGNCISGTELIEREISSASDETNAVLSARDAIRRKHPVIGKRVRATRKSQKSGKPASLRFVPVSDSGFADIRVTLRDEREGTLVAARPKHQSRVTGAKSRAGRRRRKTECDQPRPIGGDD